jgi:outer membrane protein
MGGFIMKLRKAFALQIFLWTFWISPWSLAWSGELTSLPTLAAKTPETSPTSDKEKSETLPSESMPSQVSDRELFNRIQGPVAPHATQMEREVQSSGAAGLRLGLKDCIQMALLNNRQIKAKDYDIQAAEWKLSEAKAGGIPVLNYEFLSAPAPRNVNNAVESFFSGDVTYLQRGKIELAIPLLTFGKLQLAQSLAETGIDAEKEKKIDTQNDITLKVKKLYFGILLAQDVEELLQDAIKQMSDEIQRRESSSTPTDPVDLVRLKLFRYEVIRRLAETQKKGYLAREGLRIQLGLERPINFELLENHLQPVEFEEKEFSEYLATSQKFRPENRLLDLGVKAKEAAYELEKRKIAPDIGVGGYYSFGVTTNSIQGLQLTDDFNDPFNFQQVGFGLRVKGDLNIKGYIAKVHQAEADYFKTSLEKHTGDEGLELDLKEAYLNVIQSKQGLKDADSAKKLARQFVFLTKTNMDIGVGDKKDYSDALQAYLVSRGRYLEAVFDYNTAVATLEQKAGGPAQPR